MVWSNLMNELEEKVIGTIKGTFRPIDGIPFFIVQYTPEEEKEALRQFKLLVNRFSANKLSAEFISLTKILKETLIDLIGVNESTLEEKLKELENRQNRTELAQTLADQNNMPQKVSEILIKMLKNKPKNHIAILLRTGSLYPFVRISSILSRLENEIKCILVITYPSNIVGEMLGAKTFDLSGPYYHAEIIKWKG